MRYHRLRNVLLDGIWIVVWFISDMADYSYHSLFHDMGLELLLTWLLVSVSLTPLRVVQIFFVLTFILFVVKKRESVVGNAMLLRAGMVLYSLIYIITYLFAVGTPDKDSIPRLEAFFDTEEARRELDPDGYRYNYPTWVGAHPSTTLLATLFVTIALFRLLLGASERHRKEEKPNHVVSGNTPVETTEDILTKFSDEISNARIHQSPMTMLQPSDWENIIVNPSRAWHYIVKAWAALYIAPICLFLDGIVGTSVLNLLLVTLAVQLYRLRYRLYWIYFKVWPHLVKLQLGILVATFICNIPSVAKVIEDAPVVWRALGFTSNSGEQTMELNGWRVVAILASVLQLRFFHSLIFFGKLLQLHQEAIDAKLEHVRLHLHEEEIDAAAAAEVRRKNQARSETLRKLREDRKKGPTIVTVAKSPDPALNAAARQEEMEDLGLAGLFAEDEPSMLQQIKEKILAALDDALQEVCKHTFDPQPPDLRLHLVVRWAIVLHRYAVRHTKELCFLLVTINFAASGTLWDGLLCSSAWLYGALRCPWPARWYWTGTMMYSSFGITIKTILRLIAEQAALGDSTVKIFSIIMVNLGVAGNATGSRSQLVTTDLILNFLVLVVVQLHLVVSDDHGVYYEEARENLKSEEELSSVGSDSSFSSESEADSGFSDSEEANSEEDIAELMQTVRASPEFANAVRKRRQSIGVTLSEESSYADQINFINDESVSLPTRVYRNLVHVIGVGADLYTITFLLECFSLAYGIINYFSLAGRASGSFLQSVSQNLLPGPLVVLMMVMIIVMVCDRIIYTLAASHREVASMLKFGLQFTLTATYHITYIVWMAEVAEVATGGAVLLCLKLGYLYLSGVQLHNGFPLFRRHDPFTNSAIRPRVIIYKIYRRIPFLWDLRVMLDWTFTNTTLKFFDFLKVEDIAHEVYLRYGEMVFQEGTNPRRGTSQPLIERLIDGALLFGLVLVIIFFPLGFYSAFNPGLAANPVSSITMDVGLGSYGQVYTGIAVYSVSPRTIGLTEVGLSRMRPSLVKFEFLGEDKSFQVLRMEKCSTSLWQLSPTSEAALLAQLRRLAIGDPSAPEIAINIIVTVTRPNSAAGADKIQLLRNEIVLTQDETAILHDQLQLAINSTLNVNRTLLSTNSTAGLVNLTLSNITDTNITEQSVTLSRFINPFIDNQPTTVGFYSKSPNLDITCKLILRSETSAALGATVRYWCIECQGLFTAGNVPRENTPEADCVFRGVDCGQEAYEYNAIANEQRPINATTPYFVVSSTEVPTRVNLIPIDIGIVALYTTFIFAIGNVIRAVLTGMAHRIVLEDVADPRCLAELISYIYLSRGSSRKADPTSPAALKRGDNLSEGGDLELEEQMFLELLDLLRSPETLIRRSGLRVDTYEESGPRRLVEPMLKW